MDARRRDALGKNAERRALARLRRAGLTLVARNFRTRYGEIDLVMQDDACLVFVEVRFRGPTAFGHAAGSVDSGKQRRLVRAADTFLVCQPRWRHHPVRFDVMAMNATDGGALKVDWIRDAFRPD